MLTVSQAAKTAGISDALIYAACANGEIEHYRFGVGQNRGTIRITPEALEAYLQSRRVPPCPSRSTEPASVGSFNLSAAKPGAESELAAFFRRAGAKPRPRNTTASKQRASMHLSLVSPSQSR